MNWICNNCGDKHHQQECNRLCSKCFSARGNAPHECQELPYRRPTHDRIIVRKDGYFTTPENQYVHFNEYSLPRSIDFAVNSFKARLGLMKISIINDNAFVSSASSMLTAKYANCVVMPKDVVRFDLRTLIYLMEHFYYAKLEAFQRVMFIPKTLKIRSVCNVEGNKWWYDFYVHLCLEEETTTIKSLFQYMDHECELTLHHIVEGDFKLTCYDFNFSGHELIISVREKLYEFEYDKSGFMVDPEDFSLKLDFGGRQLKTPIAICKKWLSRLSRGEAKPYNPEIEKHLYRFHSKFTPVEHAFGDKQAIINDTNAIDRFLDAMFKGKNKDFQLDENQRKAIFNAIKRQVTGVHGPPGTGKTEVINAVALFNALVLQENVLIVTSRNVAADNLTRKLVEYTQYLGNYMISAGVEANFIMRAYSSRKDISKIQLPDINKTNKSALNTFQKCRIVVSTVKHAFTSSVRRFNADYVCVDETDLIDPIDFYAFLGTRHVDFEVITTKKDIKKINANRFKRLLVVGDPNQMRSQTSMVKTFTNQLEFDTGINRSFLVALIRGSVNNDLVVTLNVCHRGPKPLYDILFGIFYKGIQIDIKTYQRGIFFDKNDDNFWPNSTRFPEIQKMQKAHLDSVYIKIPPYSDEKHLYSSVNEKSQEIAFEMIKFLLNFGYFINGGKITANDILYTSFYKMQTIFMAKKLESDEKTRNVRVLTGSVLQGLENRVVIVDSVRTGQNSGFLRGEDLGNFGVEHNGLCCVSLTRAVDTLIYIGNADHFRGTVLSELQTAHENLDQTSTIRFWDLSKEI